MKKLTLAGISVLLAFSLSAQLSQKVFKLDSLATLMSDNNIVPKIYLNTNQDSTLKIYRKSTNEGELLKIISVGNGQCNNHSEYFYLNGMVFKIIEKMTCNDYQTYDSVLYYDKDDVIFQIDKSTALYGRYWLQSAYQYLNKYM